MYEPKYFIESMDFEPIDTSDDTIDELILMLDESVGNFFESDAELIAEGVIGDRLISTSSVKLLHKKIIKQQKDYKKHIKAKKYDEAKKDVELMRKYANKAIKEIESMDKDNLPMVLCVNILWSIATTLKYCIPIFAIGFAGGSLVAAGGITLFQAVSKASKGLGAAAITAGNVMVGASGIIGYIGMMLESLNAIISIINRIKNTKGDINVDAFDITKATLAQKSRDLLKMCDGFDEKIKFMEEQDKEEKKEKEKDDVAEESVIGDIAAKIKGKFTKSKEGKKENVSDKAEAIKKKMADLKAKEDRFNKSYDNMNATANNFKSKVDKNSQYA